MDNKRTLNPMLVVGGILILLLLVGGIFLWKGNNKSQPTTQETNMQDGATMEPSATSTTTESTPSAITAEDVVTVNVEGANFSFTPSEIRVKKGQKVKVVFTSKGGSHDFVVDQFNVKTPVISSGSTEVEFTPDKTGTFEFYCSVGMHRQMGMVGKLIVE